MRGVVAKQRYLQEGQRRPQSPPSPVPAQNRDRVFTQANNTSSAAHQSAPAPTSPPTPPRTSLSTKRHQQPPQSPAPRGNHRR
jgi:hypothetical protein